MPGLEIWGCPWHINSVKNYIHAWSGNKGVVFSLFRTNLTSSSLFVNSGPERPTHLSFHSSFIKKFFLIKIKIINDILNLV